jgi:hypothetical protein
LPLPPVCSEGENGQGPNGQITCLQACEVKPAPKPFEVELKYAWGGEVTPPYASDVMMTPIVIQLDDDDCDGKVTERDIPEIVFTTFASGAYTQAGTLHAISIVGGQFVEKWSVPGVIAAAGELAAGDIDGEPGNEVVGCGKDGFLYAYKGDGSLLWKSPEPFPCRIPSIADLDQDGQPEVIDAGGIVDGKTGVSKGNFVAGGGCVLLSDADGDGKLDIVSSSRILKADGTVVANTELPGSCNAIGDLDKDGIPEIIGANPGKHAISVWHYDPTAPGNFKIIRAALDINTPFPPDGCGSVPPAGYPGGGPPTVADFNGDGFPDLALAGGLGYVVFDGKKVMDPAIPDNETFLWTQDTQDCSSAATGSSIFDFNGDGKAEVLYADETHFRIYEGATGNVLFETCNTSATLIEYPIVADVDNDGQADIIVASNAYAFNCNGVKTSGIRVFGSKNNDWVRTRRVWNQHAYHITNVEEDGTIPAVELPNWTQPGLNNFRQNKQPGLEFAAPDVVVEARPDCSKGNSVVLIVRNLGQSVLPPGAMVRLLKGSSPGGVQIGESMTTQALFPAQSEVLSFFVDDPQILEGASKVYGEVTMPNGVVECRPNNNVSPDIFAACSKFLAASAGQGGAHEASRVGPGGSAALPCPRRRGLGPGRGAPAALRRRGQCGGLVRSPGAGARRGACGGQRRRASPAVRALRKQGCSVYGDSAWHPSPGVG